MEKQSEINVEEDEIAKQTEVAIIQGQNDWFQTQLQKHSTKQVGNDTKTYRPMQDNKVSWNKAHGYSHPASDKGTKDTYWEKTGLSTNGSAM